ncbi:MAG: transcription-repair coupling factor, partial [Acidimicrobiales bacterium]|nr:transcription-repair coupling factor [Acidimicrobiales bacterium]
MPSLRSLPALLRNEPALTRVVGVPGATLAVASPAQAFVASGILRLSERRPMLLVTATGSTAEQLAHDVAVFAGSVGPGLAGADGGPDPAAARTVEVFPAWETLPFERVSPDVGTMGRRLRLLWQLGGEGAAPPDVVVAPVKALLQRLGPWRTAARPVAVAKGQRLEVEGLVETLVAAGYRREPLVEHRGELAVRGGIVDVFPSTGDVPVRIDLWGDEVDR